jgi:hypothetical protein
VGVDASTAGNESSIESSGWAAWKNRNLLPYHALFQRVKPNETALFQPFASAQPGVTLGTFMRQSSLLKSAHEHSHQKIPLHAVRDERREMRV